jgi:polynucleotide 5'-kinase involved in rRNA processing
VSRTWQIEDLVLEGTWLGSGTPLQPAALSQLGKEAGTEALYAELSGRRLGILAACPLDRDAAVLAARRLYGASAVTVTLASWLYGLLVGLHDNRRTLLGIGLVSGFDERKHTLTVLTATHAYATTRCVRFGLARLTPNGQVLGVVRPGDV